MPSQNVQIDLAAWVDRVRNDPVAHLQRQATEVALYSIARSDFLRSGLYLKGGVLMGLAYGSRRQTTDLDFTASFQPTATIDSEIKSALDRSFRQTAAALGYPDLVMAVHSVSRRPRQDLFETARGPALKIKMGFARRGTRQEQALSKPTGAPPVIDMDISFNEEIHAVQMLVLTGDSLLQAYALSDLVAEKLRALIQQVSRNRYRRQDVYDLHYLLKDDGGNEAFRRSVLQSFVKKASVRGLEVGPGSLDDPDIYRRAAANWKSMNLEVDQLPDFDASFRLVRSFFQSLPWDELESTDLSLNKQT